MLGRMPTHAAQLSVDEGWAALGAAVEEMVWISDPQANRVIYVNQAFERFFEWTSNRGIELWDHQEEALMDLAAGDHVILGTPTGSGKSFVIRRLAQEWIKEGGSAYVLCPTAEVIQQQRIDSIREGMTPVIEKAELHASRFARYIIGSFNTMWRRYEKHLAPWADELADIIAELPQSVRDAGL